MGNNRCCGNCFNHNPEQQTCLLNLSYAAFVRADAPANGCIGFIEKERAVAEAQAQSECRPVTMIGIYQQWMAANGAKP